MTGGKPRIGERYVAAQRSFAGLARTLTGTELAAPVPCCPGWTVRDVLSHAVGVPDDVLAGRLDGIATSPWTDAQVQRWRDVAVHDLLSHWEELTVPFSGVIDELGETRPLLDCHNHEHDVRHALGRPGPHDGEPVDTIGAWLAGVPTRRALTIHLRDGRSFDAGGDGTRIEVRGVSAFELMRSRLGRRSRSQMMALAWCEPPDDELVDAWFVFGPSSAEIVE